MLESSYQQQLDANRACAKSLTVLPPELQDIVQQRGIVRPIHDDRRRFVRSYCPIELLLETQQNIPSVERTREFHVVYIKDLSRGGIAFYHSAQLFPGETSVLWLPTGKRACTVARCIRRNGCCYEIGARFNSA